MKLYLILNILLIVEAIVAAYAVLKTLYYQDIYVKDTLLRK